MSGIMEKNNYVTIIFFSSVIICSLLSFALSLAAEFKKSKKEDILLDGKFCSLPQTGAFGLGLASLACTATAQIIGTSLYCRFFQSGEHTGRHGCKPGKPTLSCSLLVFSWISFGIGMTMISAATSMSRHQQFGEGWLDGECYLVKNGVYIGSAVLALVASGSTLTSATIRMRQRQTGDNTKFIQKIDDK